MQERSTEAKERWKGLQTGYRVEAMGPIEKMGRDRPNSRMSTAEDLAARANRSEDLVALGQIIPMA